MVGSRAGTRIQCSFHAPPGRAPSWGRSPEPGAQPQEPQDPRRLGGVWGSIWMPLHQALGRPWGGHQNQTLRPDQRNRWSSGLAQAEGPAVWTTLGKAVHIVEPLLPGLEHGKPTLLESWSLGSVASPVPAAVFGEQRNLSRIKVEGDRATKVEKWGRLAKLPSLPAPGEGLDRQEQGQLCQHCHGSFCRPYQPSAMPRPGHALSHSLLAQFYDGQEPISQMGKLRLRPGN